MAACGCVGAGAARGAATKAVKSAPNTNTKGVGFLERFNRIVGLVCQ